MAFPWIFHANLESGDNSEWDSESDTDSILDFPHYSELAQVPDSTSTPFSGAYCARIVPAGGTNDATLTEADINIANTVTSHFHFNLWFSTNFDATSDDTFVLLELQETGSSPVVSLGARYVASTDVINIGVGSAASSAVPSSFASLDMLRNTWYTIEMSVTIQTGGSGTVDVFITKANDAGQTTADIALTSQTHAVITDGIFGLQDHLSTTTGTILLDNFIQDDARVFPTARYELHPIFTKSGHAFVGPGHVDVAGLLTDEANNIMRLWDTDTADVNATQSFVIELDINAISTTFSGPIKFQNGCYVELSGTNPRGEIIMAQASDRPGVLGARYHNDSGVRRLGINRRRGL